MHLFVDRYTAGIYQDVDGIAFKREIRESKRIHVPAFQCVEWESRYSIHLMVCSVHHKSNTGSYLRVLSDDQFISVPFKVMCDVALKFLISNIGEVSHDDFGIRDHRVYIDCFILSWNGMGGFWIWFFPFFIFFTTLRKICHFLAITIG